MMSEFGLALIFLEKKDVGSLFKTNIFQENV